MVAANAGLAIHTFNPDSNIEDCVLLAKESLLNGKAHKTFKELLANS